MVNPIYKLPYRVRYRLSPRNWYYEVKWFAQRGQRGWSDRDWWNLDSYLNDILPPMLRKYAEEGRGYPGIKPYETAGKWRRALLKAADDIEAWYKYEDQEFPKTTKARAKYWQEHRKAQKRTLRGMEFVSKNFFDLWD